VDYEINRRQLSIRLSRDFNLLMARRIEKLAEEVDAVRIDLTQSKIVDSEAIGALHRLITSGKTVALVNPPRIFGEAIRILGLDDVIKLDEITEKK
jgi:anti-anti-sigma regulatory factor